MFDVRAAGEDALQVDPAALHVDPDVKQSHDAVQLVLPAERILLKHLGGGGRRKVEMTMWLLYDCVWGGLA